MLHLMCALNAAALTYVFWGAQLRVLRVTLAVERGEGGKVAEIARYVDPTAVGSATRRAGFYTDLGHGLATDRGRRGDAVAALRTAEQLAPQQVRANPYVRETVTDLLRRAP